MANPFLFDDEVEAATDSAPNPFLSNADEEPEVENPFLAEDAVNPFAFNEDESAEPSAVVEPHPHIPTVDKAMSFFGTTITEDDDTGDAHAQAPFVDDGAEKKGAGPPPRPTPPSTTTQDLISSVADQMDQTSSHLLDRIPKTRTPSPVSMRDLHSPSPTPESANLLMSDVLETNAAASALSNDNPFANVDDEPAEAFAVQAAQPKGPPRPTPPRPVPPPQTEQKADTETDLFDFETSTAPKPPAPKSNQDILSLFSAPKAAEPPKPDLMTSDILLMSNVAPVQSNLPQEISNASAPLTTAPTPIPAPVAAPVPVPAPAPAPVPVAAPIPAAPTPAAPPARPAPPQRPAVPPQRPTPPVVPKPPVVAEPAAQSKVPNAPSNENIPQIQHEQPEQHIETAESVPIKINDEPYNGVHDVDKSESISDNSSAVDSSIRTPGISTPFYSPGPDAQYLDRGQTPVDSQLASAKEEMMNTYINEASSMDPSAVSNPFGSPENAVTPQIIQPPSVGFQQSDEFDAFAAKFDSATKDGGLTDGFGGSSGYKSPAPSDGKFDFRILSFK